MSAMRAGGALLTLGTDTSFKSRTWQSRTARLSVHWERYGAVIAAAGEIDAANAGPLVDYVLDCADSCEWLVIDLSGLEFLGTAGFSALRRVGSRFIDTGVRWTLVPGPAASRVLRVCDPRSYLPIAASLTAALADVEDERLPSVQ